MSPRLFPLISGLLGSALLLQTLSAQAIEIGLPHIPDYVPGTCIVDPHDPFEPNATMGSGALKDMCINPTRRRSVTLVKPEQAQAYFQNLKADELVVANVSHLERFWVAKIPVTQISQMFLQVEYFPVSAVGLEVDIAHTQFRFDLKDGAQVELVSQPQPGGQISSERVRLNHLIFSIENASPYGDKFNAAKGLDRDNYRLAFRLSSLPDKYHWMITLQNHKVEQYLLTYSPEEAQKILLKGIETGHHLGLKKKYHMISANCANELFRVIDSALPKGDRLKVRPAYPNIAPWAFQMRGRLSPLAWPTLNEDHDAR